MRQEFTNTATQVQERTSASEETNRLARWSRDPGRWQSRLNLMLFAVAVTAALVVVQVIDWPALSNVRVAVDDVSQVDIRAPRPVTYRSDVLTGEARTAAAAAVEPIFDPPETRIARQQITRAALVLDFITEVRSDPYAPVERKIDWLGSIADVRIDRSSAELILTLTNERWAVVAGETTRVLDQVMRSVIREGEVANAQRLVPSLIGYALDEDETAITSVLVQGLLRHNSASNIERTEAARAEAAARVAPVDKSVAAGETILRAGDIVDALDVEVLDALGLLSIDRTWPSYAAAVLLGVVLTGLLLAFINRTRRYFWADTLRVGLLGGTLVGFILLAKVMVPMHTVLPYLYPLAGMTMLIGALIDLPAALAATVIISVLVASLTQGEPALVAFPAIGAIAGALALGQAERLINFVRAGIWITLANLAVLAVFRLPLLDFGNTTGLAELAIAAVVNGAFSSSFTLVFFYLLGQVFGLTTSLQLLELSRPTHPLLRQLLLKAPGTYHHTLLVSNMAEEAATAIGADPLLARVGTYYHDIGKTVRPYFFMENNSEGVNPHERLDPYTSSRIIISHVIDDVDLARKYRLPEALIRFIREHHGVTRVEYFYHQACQEHENPDEVDEAAFRYPGPRPRSRETAILMLADGCEATVRSMNPHTTEETMELIRSVINRRLMSGQLDESEITLRDLSLIANAFAHVLQGIHHPRIRYPADGEAGRAVDRETGRPGNQ